MIRGWQTTPLWVWAAAMLSINGGALGLILSSRYQIEWWGAVAIVCTEAVCTAVVSAVYIATRGGPP